MKLSSYVNRFNHEMSKQFSAMECEGHTFCIRERIDKVESQLQQNGKVVIQ